MKQEVFLGVSSGFHDSAAALLDGDGRIIYAASEERFSRIKGDSSWPEQSINHAITVAKRQNCAIKSVCCHENIQRSVGWHLVNCLNPFSAKFKQFETLYSSLRRYSTFIENIDVLLNKLSLTRHNLYFSDHHVSHAMGAFAYSPAASGLVCVFDAFGQGSSGFVGFFDSSFNKLRVKHNFDINHSIGLFYSAITRLCGFKVLTGEYKLMGLAPYGTPSMYKKLRDIFGNPTLQEFNTSILDPFADDIANNDLVFALDIQQRIPESPISQPYMDLAASAQTYLEELVVNILKHEVSSLPKDLEKNIILGGGVALNCKLTHLIQKKFSDFDVYICPAAGDSGSAIGACYSKILAEISAKPSFNTTAYLGTDVDPIEVKDYLGILGFKIAGSPIDLKDDLISLLIEGKVGALFQGKSEFGPRALGNRSIIADPSKHNALAKINKFIKAREDFRPLAPITTIELAQSHFNILSDDLLLHHMLTLVDVPLKVRHLIRSAVHIDGSARLQVISQEENHFAHALISTFYARTGVPALINTSFNQRGEPIVNTLEDALCCFSSANLDFLVAADSVLFRESQDDALLFMHKNHAGFPLD